MRRLLLCGLLLVSSYASADNIVAVMNYGFRGGGLPAGAAFGNLAGLGADCIENNGTCVTGGDAGYFLIPTGGGAYSLYFDIEAVLDPCINPVAFEPGRCLNGGAEGNDHGMFIATGTVFGQQVGSQFVFSGTLTNVALAPFLMSQFSLDPNAQLIGIYSATADPATGAAYQTINIVAAPEPASIVLVGSGVVLGFRRIRRKLTRNR